MNILAIDSSTTVMGVAVTSQGNLLAEYTTNLKLNHSVRLMPAIEQVLKEVGLKPAELDRIAVSKGPGSYTGIRIGVSIAKTLAWSLKKDLVGVSTLEIMAQNGHFFQGLIAPFFDARRDRVYTGLYEENEEQLKAIKPDHIHSVEVWLEDLKKTEKDVLFLGQDLSVFQDRILSHLGKQAFLAPSSLNVARAAELARLAEQRPPVPSIHHFVPDYLQMAEAEAKWQESQNTNMN